MPPKVIRSSRRKIFLYFFGCLVFVAVSFWLLQDPDNDGFINTLGMVSFGLCAGIMGWNLIRPEKIVLDEEGFTLSGGFWFKAKRVYWRDVDKFFIHTMVSGGKVIAYNLKPSAQKNSALAQLSRAMSAEGVLSATWTLSNDAMVEELNSYIFRVQSLNYNVPR